MTAGALVRASVEDGTRQYSRQGNRQDRSIAPARSEIEAIHAREDGDHEGDEGGDQVANFVAGRGEGEAGEQAGDDHRGGNQRVHGKLQQC